VSWGHAQHPISLRPLVVSPHRQVVMETSASTDDAPIPVSLVQYLWSRWQKSPPDVRDAVTAAIGNLMRSPRWPWDVTVLPEHAPTNPSNPCVIERDGRPTIGIPIAMLRDLWRWVLGNIDERAAVLRWWAPTLDSSLWQELYTYRRVQAPWVTEQAWYRLYGYLPPLRLPDIVRETDHLLASADPDDHQRALTMLERWLASDDHATRTLAAQMLATWLHARTADGTVTDDHLRPRLRALTILASDADPRVVCAHLYHLLRTARNRITPDDVRTVIDLLHGLGDGRLCATDRWRSLIGEMVRDHSSDDVIREMLNRLIPAILPSVRPDDRVAWAATLWDVVTDPTLGTWRRQTIATALTSMMQDPMVAARVHAQLCTEPSLPQTIPAPIRDTLLAGLIQTTHADAVLNMIAQEIRQDPNAIARFAPIVAAGWGHGHDQRILQMVTAHPSPHWQTVLTQGITTSVGAEVCAFIQSQAQGSPDHTVAVIMEHVGDREKGGDWPLVPLPAYLIPWVGEAARTCPDYLPSNTIRRLWPPDPDQAWNVTQTMLRSDDPSVQWCARKAMDAGWGTGHDEIIAQTLWLTILDHQRDPSVAEAGIATAVAGLGTAPPSLMEPLLTALATSGNTDVQRWLIRELHRGWGRGQDALVMRIVQTIADRTSSERVWGHGRITLARAWNHQPPQVVLSLIDRLLTHALHPVVHDAPSVAMAAAVIGALAYGWRWLPPSQIIPSITRHCAHLRRVAHTLNPDDRGHLVFTWASAIAAGMERLSASDIHALLFPLWKLDPILCYNGVYRWFR
jgi:hypothetical protein